MRKQKDIKVKVTYSEDHKERFTKAMCELYFKKKRGMEKARIVRSD